MTVDTTGGRPAVADLIRWGPTIAAVLIAAAVFTTVNAAWLALAFGATDDVWRNNLPWFLGGTAAASLFLAGLFAGLFSGIRGVAAGLVNGATAWGLFFLLSIGAGLPGAVNLDAQLRSSFAEFGDEEAADISTALWTAFWALLVGALLALLGGAVGGTVHRTVRVAEVAGGRERPSGPAAQSASDDQTYPIPYDTTDTLIDRPPGP